MDPASAIVADSARDASAARVSESPPNAAAADDWPGWRGGWRHGVTSVGDTPVRFGADAGVAWKAPLPGAGNSSPVVAAGSVFVTTAAVENNAALAARVSVRRHDLASGELLWEREVGVVSGPTHRKNGWASATPAWDGQALFVAFGAGGLCRVDLHGGVRWRVAPGDARHEWGFASSPVLWRDLVIVSGDVGGGEEGGDPATDGCLAAHDKATGRLIWRAARPGRGSWSTPVVVEPAAGESRGAELVTLGAGGAAGQAGLVTGHDPATGRLLWSATGVTDIPCPTPMVGAGLVIASSGGGGPVLAIRPGGRGDVTGQRVAWREEGWGPYAPTGVIVGQRLFLLSDAGLLRCCDARAGTVLGKRRLPGAFSASLVAAGDKLYAASEQGVVYALAAAPDLELLAENRLEETILATPAPVAGALLVRTREHLWCARGDAGDPVGNNPRGEKDAAPNADSRPRAAVVDLPSNARVSAPTLVGEEASPSDGER